MYCLRGEKDVSFSRRLANVYGPSVRRSKVLTAVKMSMFVFWVVTPCGLVGRCNVSEEHTASILNPEDGDSMFLNTLVYISTRSHGVTTQNARNSCNEDRRDGCNM
jgi:hypothetical protein